MRLPDYRCFLPDLAGFIGSITNRDPTKGLIRNMSLDVQEENRQRLSVEDILRFGHQILDLAQKLLFFANKVMHNKSEKEHFAHKNVAKKDAQQGVGEVEIPIEEGPNEGDLGVAAKNNGGGSTDALEALKGQLAEEHDMHMRALASLDNLKKRVQRERDEMRTAITSAFVEDLLPVLDHFELGLQSAAQDNASNVLAGFKMIFDQFRGILNNYGLVVIDPLNQVFDPHEHDCIRREYSDSQPENVVLLVMRKGYKIRDRLIRPASVVVSTKQQAQKHE